MGDSMTPEARTAYEEGRGDCDVHSTIMQVMNDSSDSSPDADPLLDHRPVTAELGAFIRSAMRIGDAGDPFEDAAELRKLFATYKTGGKLPEGFSSPIDRFYALGFIERAAELRSHHGRSPSRC